MKPVRTEERQEYKIRQGSRYLVGIPYPRNMVIRWSTSPWDGYPTKSYATARALARRVGGTVVVFDPITGEVAG